MPNLRHDETCSLLYLSPLLQFDLRFLDHLAPFDDFAADEGGELTAACASRNEPVRAAGDLPHRPRAGRETI